MNKWLLIALTLPTLIFSEETNSIKTTCVNFDSEPSATVGGCVNAISGTYVQHEIDLEVPGPLPLTLERFYQGHETGTTTHARVSKFGNWQSNVQSHLARNLMCDSMLGTIFFDRGPENAKRISNISPEFHQGLTNMGQGVLSGRTNVKNFLLVREKSKGALTLGSGEYREYERKEPSAKFYIEDYSEKNIIIPKKIIKPSGTKYLFENKTPSWKNVRTTNHSESIIFGSLSIPEPFDEDGKKIRVITSSDGRTVRYIYDIYTMDKNRLWSFNLTDVERPNKPNVSYENFRLKNNICTGCKSFIKKRKLPNGRYQEIDYYSIDRVDRSFFKKYGLERLLVSPCHPEWRVKQIKEPVGFDETAIPVYSFFYENHHYYDIPGRVSSAFVYDAYDHKTRYIYDHLKRLIKTEKFIGQHPEHELISYDEFEWGDKGVNAGNLLSKGLFHPNGNPYYKNEYVYDDRGNVIEEKLTGNLTGSGSQTYSKKYTFSDDGFNLMLSESDDRFTIYYQYKPNTDLLTAKLTCDSNGVIQLREFNEYDHNATCIVSIQDNGQGTTLDDLTGVTKRLIRRVTPKEEAPCVGYPVIVEDYYYDLEEGIEKSLGKKVQTFSLEGWMTHQEVYDADGNFCYEIHQEYDDHGNVILEQDALGYVIQKQYDENDNLVLEVGPNPDRVKKYTYDFMNRLVQEEEISSDQHFTKSYEYDYKGNQTVCRDIFGVETYRYYDEFSREIKTELPFFELENGRTAHPTIQKRYDIAGNVIEEIDPDGNSKKTKWNIRGRPTRIDYADGSFETYEYNLDGTLKRSVARNGTWREMDYDDLGHMTTERLYGSDNSLLSTTHKEYKGDLLVSSTDPKGIVTILKYDGGGRIIEERCNDQVTRTEYDSRGRINKIIRELGDSVQVNVKEYDLKGQVLETRTEDESGVVLLKASYAYDADGNRVEEIHYHDGATAVTRTHFDAHGKPIQVIDPMGHASYISYDYCFLNEMNFFVLQTTATDAKGQRTITTHDVLGKPVTIEKQDPYGNTIALNRIYQDEMGRRSSIHHIVYVKNEVLQTIVNRWEYDVLGNVLRQIEAEGTPEQRHTCYRYTKFGERSEILKPDGIQIHFEFNERGLLAHQRSSDQSIDYQFSYDENGNLILARDLRHDEETLRSYNENNLLSSETLGNGLTLVYQYDQLGRPTKVRLPDETIIDYKYDAAFLREVNYEGLKHQYLTYDLSGQLLEESHTSGLYTSYQYDPSKRLIEQSNEIRSQSSIQYDEVGNLLSYQLHDPQGKKEVKFDYDPLYQLTSETGLSNHTYEYDSLNNRLKKDDLKTKYNSLNQLVSFGETKYTYDLSGNLVTDGKRNYKYDALDRLIEIEEGEDRYRYQYDFFNRRLSKTIDFDDSTVKEIYFYQGQNEIGAYRDGELIQKRILGSGKGAEIGASVLVYLEGEVLTPLHDLSGNITCLTKQNNSVVESYRFSTFGEMESFVNHRTFAIFRYWDKSTPLNPWRFSSKRIDNETGLIYFGRRYYDPEIGRWITTDPKGFDAGPNLYAYVMNSPLTHIDDYGLCRHHHHRHHHHHHSHADRDHHRDLWSRIVKSVEKVGWKARESIGRGMNFITRHCIPIPVIRNVCAAASRYVARGNLSWVNTGFPTDHRFCIAGTEKKPSGINVFGSGMNCLPPDAVENGKQVTSITGSGTIVSSSLTGGVLFDFGHHIMVRLGVKTDTVWSKYHDIKAGLDALEGTDKKLYLPLHSDGTLKGYKALKMLKPEERARIDVRAFGGSIMIPNWDFNSVVNYVSIYDPIPFISSPHMHPYAYYSEKYEVRYLNPGSFKLFDHSFTGETYRNALIKDWSLTRGKS